MLASICSLRFLFVASFAIKVFVMAVLFNSHPSRNHFIILYWQFFAIFFFANQLPRKPLDICWICNLIVYLFRYYYFAILAITVCHWNYHTYIHAGQFVCVIVGVVIDDEDDDDDGGSGFCCGRNGRDGFWCIQLVCLYNCCCPCCPSTVPSRNEFPKHSLF